MRFTVGEKKNEALFVTQYKILSPLSFTISEDDIWNLISNLNNVSLNIKWK